jgi:hypothetical protein
LHISQIAAGEAHCAALDSNGQVFLWGRNTYGECGEKPEVAFRVCLPKKVSFIYGDCEKQFIMVACGGNHTMLLT